MSGVHPVETFMTRQNLPVKLVYSARLPGLLTGVDATQMELTSEQSKTLFGLLEREPWLQSLGVTMRKYDTQAYTPLEHFLSQTASLRELSLPRCGSDIGLAEGLGANRTLTRLHLGGLDFHDGFVDVAERFARHPTLAEISLGGRGLHKESLQKVVTAFSQNPRLVHLNMDVIGFKHRHRLRGEKKIAIAGSPNLVSLLPCIEDALFQLVDRNQSTVQAYARQCAEAPETLTADDAGAMLLRLPSMLAICDSDPMKRGIVWSDLATRKMQSIGMPEESAVVDGMLQALIRHGVPLPLLDAGIPTPLLAHLCDHGLLPTLGNHELWQDRGTGSEGIRTWKAVRDALPKVWRYVMDEVDTLPLQQMAVAEPESFQQRVRPLSKLGGIAR